MTETDKLEKRLQGIERSLSIQKATIVLFVEAINRYYESEMRQHWKVAMDSIDIIEEKLSSKPTKTKRKKAKK